VSNEEKVLVDRTLLRVFVEHSTGDFYSPGRGYTKHSSWNDWHDALLAALDDKEQGDEQEGTI